MRAPFGEALGSSRPHVKVGDVVLLYNDDTKKAFWKLTIVNELLKVNDDKARAAAIKVGSNKGPAKLLKSSIQCLIPIEADGDDDNMHLETTTEDNSKDNLVENPSALAAEDNEMTADSVQLRHHAAIDGEVLRRAWTGTS